MAAGDGKLPFLLELLNEDGQVVGQLRATDWWAHGPAGGDLPRVGFAIIASDVEIESR